MILIHLLYIDPGSGSYLVQVIIAGVLGAIFYFKNLWWKIKSFFSRNKNEDQPKSDN
ncbi:MAG: hypothetical protein JST87_04000 [Bacteroidetes bacterium]|nr:hypothetical protein [Bacteroidota bacterium]